MPPRLVIVMIVLAAWGTVAVPDACTAAGRKRTTDRSSVSPSDEFSARSAGRRTRSRMAAGASGGHAGSVFLSVPAPLDEDFESTVFPPTGWTILNPDAGSITWEHATGVSGYGTGQGSAWMDFYDYEVDVGDIDELRTPAVTGLAAGDSLFVDYAYAEYDDPFYGPDSLIIRLSLDNGSTFPVTLFADGGSTLATAAATDLPFVPTGSDWRTIRTALPPAVGGADVVVSLTGINGYSNNLYIDNIFLGSVPVNDVAPSASLTPVAGSKQRTTFTPTGLFRNRGTALQTGVPVRCRILSPASVLLYDQTLTIPSLPPGGLDSVSFPPFGVPANPGAYTVRFIAANPGDTNRGNDTLAVTFLRPAQLAGEFTVGAGGQLPTLGAAVDTLNASDIAGPVTFRLISSTYNEAGPLTIRNLEGSGPAAPVTITPSAGHAVTVTVPGTLEEPYALAVLGSSYLSIEGSGGVEGAGAQLTIEATGEDGAVGVFIGGVEGRSSSHCAVRDVAVRTGADPLLSSGGYYGILVSGYSATQRDSGVVIERCDITRHGQAGIASQNTHGLVVNRCRVYGWRQEAGFTDLRGIWLAAGSAATTVGSTVIDSIVNGVNGWWAFGLQGGGGEGSALLCMNTSISRVRSEGAGTDQNIAAGIWLSGIFNEHDRILHTSISLDGRDSSTNALSRSSGIDVAAGAAGFSVRNCIVRNATEHGAGGPAAQAFALHVPAAVWSPQDTSNTNDLIVPGSPGAVGFFNGAARAALADWQTATGQDFQSMSADPLFAGADNLHIALGTSPVGNAGVPLGDVQADIDGEPRDPVAPDMGSDEFAGNSITIPVPLREGWNMVANPVDRAPGTDSVAQIYPSALFPYAFSFSPVAGYRQERVLVPGSGYWEKFGVAQHAYIGGGIRSADTVEVQPGWNMVGSISVPVDTGAVLSVPPDLRTSLWFGYDGAYSSVESLVPGRAYWVKASAAGVFILASALRRH